MFPNRPAQKHNNKSGKSDSDYTYDIVNTLQGKIENVYTIRDAIQQKLLSEYKIENINPDHSPELTNEIQEIFDEYLAERHLALSKDVRKKLLDWILSDLLGYGPIQPLLDDPYITEVMVNGPKKIYIEKHGKIEKTNIEFENDAHVRRIIDRIVTPIGRRVDEASPMVDARLPNGFRVNATIPPISLEGSLLTIRKFAQDPYTAQDLIAFRTLTSQFVTFLKACVEARVNIVISGGTGTGKTTLLNVASAYIPSGERVITIEDSAELQLQQDHVIKLESRPPNVEGKGQIKIRQLVINALRMRPDRIVVGEARGGEALDMLQAMNTGHDGSMTTIHSNSPRDTLRRIETMVMMAEVELPLTAIREQVSSAIDMIVHLSRMRDGSRRVVQVAEVQKMEGQTILMQDLYKFESDGFENGRVIGGLRPTGLMPSFLEKFDFNMVKFPEGVLDRNLAD